MFPRKYVTGEDLDSKAWTVTIARVVQEQMRPGKNAPLQDKWVVYFVETPRGVILCRTLAYQIAEAVGSDDTDQWAGKEIIIHPERVTVAGRTRTAIRARSVGSESENL